MRKTAVPINPETKGAQDWNMRATIKIYPEDNLPKSWKHFTEEHMKEHLDNLLEWEKHVKDDNTNIHTNTNFKVMKLFKSLLGESPKILVLPNLSEDNHLDFLI